MASSKISTNSEDKNCLGGAKPAVRVHDIDLAAGLGERLMARYYSMPQLERSEHGLGECASSDEDSENNTGSDNGNNCKNRRFSHSSKENMNENRVENKSKINSSDVTDGDDDDDDNDADEELIKKLGSTPSIMAAGSEMNISGFSLNSSGADFKYAFGSEARAGLSASRKGSLESDYLSSVTSTYRKYSGRYPPSTSFGPVPGLEIGGVDVCHALNYR